MGLFGGKKVPVFEAEQAVEKSIPASEEIKLPKMEELTINTEAPAQMNPEIEEKAVAPEMEAAPEVEVNILPPVIEGGGGKPKKLPPLFIKIEKYEEILKTIADVRNVLVSLKNSFSLLDKTEEARYNVILAIREDVKEMVGRVGTLSSVFFNRPSQGEISEEKEYKTEEMKDVLSSLKVQIDQLKQDLESVR